MGRRGWEAVAVVASDRRVTRAPLRVGSDGRGSIRVH